MRASPMQYEAVRSSRHLHVVPDRRVLRAAHVPPGRALHLVDLENLIGGPLNPTRGLDHASEQYRGLAPVGSGDHVVVATNPALVVEAALAWPGAQILSGRGPDGADLALIDHVHDYEWAAARYDRVVIGSGDGIFASLAATFRRMGIAVGVIACDGGVSINLIRNTDFLRLLPDPIGIQVVA